MKKLWHCATTETVSSGTTFYVYPNHSDCSDKLLQNGLKDNWVRQNLSEFQNLNISGSKPTSKTNPQTLNLRENETQMRINWITLARTKVFKMFWLKIKLLSKTFNMFHIQSRPNGTAKFCLVSRKDFVSIESRVTQYLKNTSKKNILQNETKTISRQLNRRCRP